MARYNPHHDSTPIYAAAARWNERCLLADGSVFQDGLTLWSVDLLDELDRTFVQNLDEGEGDFFGKLQKQLVSGSERGCRLMAEILWVLMLFQSNIGPNKKRENVQQVWAWSGETLTADHPMLSDAVLEGLGSAGTAYNTHRWREIAFLIGAMRDLKGRAPTEREQLLADPWKFVGWLSERPGAKNRQLSHILPHLVFPDAYERISSTGDKQAIVAAFGGIPPKEVRKMDPPSVDRKLLETRQRLEQERGASIDFYEEQYKKVWRDESRLWLLSWNPENWNWDTLSEDRSMTRAGQSVVHPWRCASTFPSEGDQVYLVRTGTEPKGIVASGTVARASYEAPHYDTARASAGETTRFIDVKFSGVRDAERDQIVPLDALQSKFPEQTWNPQSSGIEIAPKAVGLLAKLWKETAGLSQQASTAVPANVPALDKELADIRSQITREDLLAAIGSLDRGEPNSFGPSTVYDVVHNGHRYPPKAVVGLAAQRALGRPLRPDEFSGGQDAWAFGVLREYGFEIVRKDGLPLGALEEESAAGIEASPASIQPEYTMEQFVADTNVPEVTVGQWLTALRRKGQIVLQGPPGTGKTFIAQRLARLLVSGSPGVTELVQFHPSYTYEDFIEGIRPDAVEGGGLRYSVAPGRFVSFCKRSEAVAAPSVMIIDELNRANLSRVFGELMYLLEYRDAEVPLATGGKLKIPHQVYIIGTMNTADRSIALVDHALRRRFAFIYLDPDYNMLDRELAKHGLPAQSLIETLRRVNAVIDDRNFSIGVSYFLKDGPALKSALEGIWRTEIEPYLEEYFYDQPAKAKEFVWAELRQKALADWG